MYPLTLYFFSTDSTIDYGEQIGHELFITAVVR